MSIRKAKRKTCNEVNIRQSSLASRSRRHERQSSITFADSGQAGTTNAGRPATDTANRPRLNAMASSNGSRDSTVAVTRAVPASNAAATSRADDVVHRFNAEAAALAPFEIEILRAARVQWMVSCGLPAVSRNTASLPSATAA